MDSIKVVFSALVKEVFIKALVSGDKSFRVVMQGDDIAMAQAGAFPADQHVKVTIELLPNDAA